MGAALSCQQPYSWQLEGQQHLDPKRGGGQFATVSSCPGSYMWGRICVGLSRCDMAGVRKEPKMDSVHGRTVLGLGFVE